MQPGLRGYMPGPISNYHPSIIEKLAEEPCKCHKTTGRCLPCDARAFLKQLDDYVEQFAKPNQSDLFPI